MSKICPQCNAATDDNAQFCTNCGNSFAQQAQPVSEPQYQQPVQPQYEQPVQQPVNQYAPQPTYYQQAPAQPMVEAASVRDKIFSIIGFATGIASLALCWLFIYPVILGIIGFIFSLISKNSFKGRNISGPFAKFAKLGFIFSIIGFAVGVIATIIWFAAIGAASAVASAYYY